MRTPSWETSTGALAAMFAEGGPLLKADAYTLTLPSGTVYQWSGAQVPLLLGARLFSVGPGIKRSLIKWRLGISTDTMTLQVTDVSGTTVNGQPLAAVIAARGLQGSRLLLERVFWRPTDSGPVGALTWFVGEVEDAEGDRREATVRVASYTKRLEVAVPRDVWQSQCKNELFDARCGISRAAYTVTGAAASASNSFRTSFSHALAAPAEWGTLGVITMTSGANAGVTRTCKQQTAGLLVALQPWPFPVASGDTFSLQAGCDRARGTCITKFANLARFRATPFIPAPETVL